MNCPVCKRKVTRVPKGHHCSSCQLIFPARVSKHRRRKSLINHHFGERE